MKLFLNLKPMTILLSSDHSTDCEPHEEYTEEADETGAQLSPEYIVLTKLSDELILRFTVILHLTLMHLFQGLDVSLGVVKALVLTGLILVLLRLRILGFTEHDIVEGDIQSQGDVGEGLHARIRGASIHDVVDRVKRDSGSLTQIVCSDPELVFPGFDALTNSFTIHFVIPFNTFLL